MNQSRPRSISFAAFDAGNRCFLALATLHEFSLTTSNDMQNWQPRKFCLVARKTGRSITLACSSTVTKSPFFCYRMRSLPIQARSGSGINTEPSACW